MARALEILGILFVAGFILWAIDTKEDPYRRQAIRQHQGFGP